MHIELESISALEAHVAEHGDLCHAVVQGLDLRGHTPQLSAFSSSGTVFLGCRMSSELLEHVHETGGLVFPRLSGLPYHPYRPQLYTPGELMEGYERGRRETFDTRTLDARIYAHYERHRARDTLPIVEALGQRLHDHAIDDALYDHLAGGGERLRVVGIMGGHAMGRAEAPFAEVARLGRGLTRAGYHVVTGGGPGAMEAANLGAWMAASRDEADLAQALGMLEAAPSYRHPGWFDTAYAVRERFPDGAASLAVPTWFYGHEPSNLFATHIAKYFSNSLREDGLLAIAESGLVFAPGSAGTIQEVFQDAAQNHYVTFGVVSPMVFLGRRYWTEERPVYPLLRDLSRGRAYERMVTITDDVDRALAFIREHPPERPAG